MAQQQFVKAVIGVIAAGLVAGVATGCVVNGKSYGPGSSNPPPQAMPPAHGTAAPAASGGEPSLGAGFEPTAASPAGGHYAKYAPYSSAPVDPWAGVDGSGPRRRANRDWIVRGDAADCSAARDHCLAPDAWFLVRASDHANRRQTIANVNVFGPDQPLGAANARGRYHGEAYVAYRTVPATRANFVPGAVAFGLERPHTQPGNGQAAVELTWWYGVVESVDPDVGVYKLQGYGDTLLLSGARVGVLTWQPGQPVQILGGRRRDQLAVRAQDTFAPQR
ncbi:MAG: hypothetical protein H0X17_11365 [Deltaproteobacteria bacterium]|nr:hypothetical protein [Deltaproteobacteria bacterium]